jgi:hypothetical protein
MEAGMLILHSFTTGISKNSKIQPHYTVNAFLFFFVPEPHHNSPSHIFDCPEIQGQEKSDGHKVADKVLREPVAQKINCIKLT